MFSIGERNLDLSEFGAVWWRRPQQPEVSNDITDLTNRQFATNECAEALGGLWHALDAFWVNDPAKDHVAHRKVMQLRRAQECGLQLPHTLITNDPVQAKIFIDGRGYKNIAYKAFSALESAWRETRILQISELSLLNNVKYAPLIFQEYIQAECDVRITMVGAEIFAAAIYSQKTSYPVDFRMDMASAEIKPITIPDHIENRLKLFMQVLGLQYGAIDMRIRPDGEYVFLEINPAGQWLFVEEATHQPIAAALAQLLVEGDVTNVRPQSRHDQVASITNDLM
jgi:glutathione synthase/RimK-type ligase-like ATP-grasp enzyme